MYPLISQNFTTTYLISSMSTFGTDSGGIASWNSSNEASVSHWRESALHKVPNSHKFWGGERWTLTPNSITYQMCLIGFRSGELCDQYANYYLPLCSSDHSITFLALWHGALSFILLKNATAFDNHEVVYSVSDHCTIHVRRHGAFHELSWMATWMFPIA